MRPLSQLIPNLITLLIGFPISLGYLYNQDDFNWWLGGFLGDRKMAADYPEHLILISMILLFLFSVRSLAIVTTSQDAFRARPGDEFSNLDRMMTFRNSRMNAMTYEQGAQLMRETQMLDAAASGAYSNRGQTQRVATYMNSRLGGMTNEQGLEWLRNPSKK